MDTGRSVPLLIAVDPSVSASGVAIFEDGELASAWLVQATDWRQMVLSIASSVRREFPNGWDDFDLVIERPQIYVRKTKRYDDIMKIMLVVGGLGVAFRDVSLTLYLPQQWKGNVKKEVVVERVEKRLKESGELSRLRLPKAKSLRHNVFDAAGMGLFHLKRVRRGGAKNKKSSHR